MQRIVENLSVSIADLVDSESVGVAQIAEAVQYRRALRAAG